MDTEKITILDLLQLEFKEHDDLRLKCIAGRPGLIREITLPEIDRPGLALSGFFENFAYKRIQVFGRGENSYLQKLEQEERNETIQKILEHDIPCCIFTQGMKPTKVFHDMAEKSKCPVLLTDLPSSEFTARIMRVLSNIFAPNETVHGVLVEVFGVGILIRGDSGVGKSEIALELIERGHRLVADDAVKIRCVSGNFLMGNGASIVISHHMEIRGLGIINITKLFGVGAIRDEKRVEFVVQLEEWDSKKVYDRIGTEEKTEILGIKVPYIVIPVKPGRNIPIIIETAAMNERLKRMGYDSAKEFSSNVMNWLETKSARAYFLDDKNILK
jgi:HPr kinase/phosphorylase